MSVSLPEYLAQHIRDEELAQIFHDPPKNDAVLRKLKESTVATREPRERGPLENVEFAKETGISETDRSKMGKLFDALRAEKENVQNFLAEMIAQRHSVFDQLRDNASARNFVRALFDKFDQYASHHPSHLSGNHVNKFKLAVLFAPVSEEIYGKSKWRDVHDVADGLTVWSGQVNRDIKSVTKAERALSIVPDRTPTTHEPNVSGGRLETTGEPILYIEWLQRFVAYSTESEAHEKECINNVCVWAAKSAAQHFKIQCTPSDLEGRKRMRPRKRARLEATRRLKEQLRPRAKTRSY